MYFNMDTKLLETTCISEYSLRSMYFNMDTKQFHAVYLAVFYLRSMYLIWIQNCHTLSNISI